MCHWAGGDICSFARLAPDADEVRNERLQDVHYPRLEAYNRLRLYTTCAIAEFKNHRVFVFPADETTLGDNNLEVASLDLFAYFKLEYEGTNPL